MRLPSYLTELSPIRETLFSIEGEMERLQEDTATRNAQLSISTATDGLSLWERDYALPSYGSSAIRRGRICSALAGSGTLTKTALEQLAIAVGGATSGEVVETFNTYHVTLYALYESHLPDDLSPLKEALDQLKPAHLSVDIVPALLAQGKMGGYTAMTGKAHLVLRGHTDT